MAEARVDWGLRAGVAERVVVARFLRPLAGVLPGTRIGRVTWPRGWPAPPGPWHYWWQAHLLDCLVDAQLRAPTPARARAVAALARSVRLRNLGRWTNAYHDDVAWFGLAVQRAGALAGRARGPALAAITTQLRAAWSAALGGGIPWRRGDDFKNAPANGPAAILLARAGELHRAAAITDWLADVLVDPGSGLVRDGIRPAAGGGGAVAGAVYTYCQGVYLGACVELAERDGDPRWSRRAAALVDAVTRWLGPGGVASGGDGDGGLFAGILMRYLADAAVRRPDLAEPAGALVRAGAAAAWRNRREVSGGPVFGPDWSAPAQAPRPGGPEAQLSVQLSGWMALEAAARLARGR